MDVEMSHSFTRFWYRCCPLLLPALFTSIAFPVHAASETASVTADVIIVITLTNRSGLVFGDISTSNSPGTVVLTPDGSRNSTGGASFNSTVASGPAVFDVAGEPNSTYSISLPATVVLSEFGGSNMVVDNFASLPVVTGLTDSGGQQSLFVGATLNVDSNQLVGRYSGTMSVTIGYN